MGWEWRQHNGPWEPAYPGQSFSGELRWHPDDPQPWTTLAKLRPGAVFETRDGWRGLKMDFCDGHEGRAASLVNGTIHYFSESAQIREIVLPEG